MLLLVGSLVGLLLCKSYHTRQKDGYGLPTNCPTNNYIDLIWMSKKIGLKFMTDRSTHPAQLDARSVVSTSPIIDLFLLLGMSNPIGIVMGQFCTPFIVKKPEDVPLMNIIWFIPAGLGALLTIWKVIAYLS